VDVRQNTLVSDIIENEDAVTVLLAEDNEVNLMLARTIIKRVIPNVTLLEARNGKEALDYCKTKLPDLIFMDVQMPEMNGYQATMSIREIEPEGHHTPIIALTAGNVKSEREKCIEAGMDDFVVKPVVEKTIAVVLDKWLRFNQSNFFNRPEDIIENKAPHFDLDKIKLYIGDNEEILNEVIMLARSELIQSASILSEYICAENIKGLNQAGHKLYGMAVTAGLPYLAKFAGEFEHLEEFKKETVNELYTQTKTEIELLLQLMQA
jgi:CheY-like chemotaxis protein/HPt (histidine-containing phosphotransfer) domain-containing protein